MSDTPGKSLCGLHITRLSLAIGILLSALWWLGETLVHCYVFKDGNFLHSFILMDANELWMRSLITVMVFVAYSYAVSERIYRNRALGIIARQRSRMLCGILPICSYCKKIRGSDKAWHKIESYISQHTGVDFTHGICPDCIKKIQ